MASTYSTRLRLELMGSGDQSGTWGTTTNTNLGTLLEASIAGRAVVSMTDADYTLTIANGATDEARNMILNISGALTATRNVICPAVSKLYIVKNATTGGQSIIFKTSAGTGVTIGNGLTSLVFCDGTNVVEGINRVGDLAVAGTTTQFTATAARIQGDFSNATPANRTAFQDKTTNNSTDMYVIPNGTSSTSGVYAWANSNPNNTAYIGMGMVAGNAVISSEKSGSGTASPLMFNVNAAERARFTTDGYFLIGRTSYSFLSGVAGTTINQIGQFISETAYPTTLMLLNGFGAGVADYSAINIYRGGNLAGNIYTSNGNTTTYATSSDYRLKSNAQPLTTSGAFIDGLQPKTWTWLSSGTQGVGFIAHEAAQVAPRSVSGQKDEIDADGAPKYQSVGYGSGEIIANIVAELQSLRARVAALEAK